MLSKEARRDVLYSQGVLYFTLLVCILISPASLTANAGISYFGHHRWTVAPFELGMFISVYYLTQARRLIGSSRLLWPLHIGLSIIIPGMIGIAIAPAIGSGWLDVLHRIFGTLVFLTELVLAGWLVLKIRLDHLNGALWALQWAGGIVALIYLNPPTGYSIEGQLLFQLAFSALLIRSLKIPFNIQ